ncbi:MAG: DegT/DnrJ/EryC1/StrS family aminotransferase [Betaproteobacteria bacterium]|nr:DegT/DnrJ/EryC1/StrS family aminotransferase [Betaproteobacteria bacterium]
MLRKEYLAFGRPNFSAEEISAVTRVLRSGWVGMGPETIAFEAELAQFLGSSRAVTLNSCTSGLFLSMRVAGVGPGDEVICPSFTWCSTADAALYLGARPVFCDIDPDTLCADPASILAKVTPRTRAVALVHFGGLAMDVAALRQALPASIAIIEDAAHALGARYPDGKRVGASGNLCCFSFYANKNLSTGEGGAVALDDAATAERLQSLRHHALPLDAWKRYSNPKTIMLSNQLTELGYKMNYTDLQASIGRVQLRRQDEFAAVRQAVAARYLEQLAELRPRIGFQRDCAGANHAKHLFVIQLPLQEMKSSREELLLGLRARNVGASIHYDPLHTMPLYLGGRDPEHLPVTEKVAKSCVTLPISASMSLDDAGYVVESFRAVFR